MPPARAAVDMSLAYLGSPAASESLRLDPYWPKWDSPWWHMTLLWESGLSARISKAAAEALAASVQSKCLPGFLPSELPGGVDRRTDILCFCGAGTLEQVLRACGVDVDARLPWLRDFSLRHALPDGGVNCDEDAYAGSLKSSFLSTLPALEAVLGRPILTPQEKAFLERGVEYLLDHRLFRSTKGAVISEDWLRPRFPRYYDYDVLRGLRFLARWERRFRRRVPRAPLKEALDAVSARFPDGRVSSLPPACLSDRHESTFPLLEQSTRPGPNAILSEEYAEVSVQLRE